MNRMQAAQSRFAGAHAEDILHGCRTRGVPVASHEDPTPANWSRIHPGLKADLVRVHIDRDLPVVRRVWRDGGRVY